MRSNGNDDKGHSNECLDARILRGRVGVLAAFGAAQAHPSSGAEARLKERRIVLPPEAAPVANFVNAARAGNLPFMAGNTGGPQWAGKGRRADT
jgi:hypothetical protein